MHPFAYQAGRAKYKLVIKVNRVKALGVLITIFFVCCSFLGLAQGTSSQGKEFWTAYMSHIEDNGESQMALYVTADDATTVKVEIADGSFPAITQDVVANQVTIINIPRVAFLQNQGQFLKGLHITAEKKIAVFAHIYASSVSGATLLLPVAVLGKSYYSINYTQKSNARNSAFSTFMVVGTEDNTTVEIIPSTQLADGTPANVPFNIHLNKGEVYQGLAFNDLTNTKIASISFGNQECKKIAVFSGSTKIAIGCNDNNFTSDNLFQQVYPTSSWGKNYITVPLKSRNFDIYRVVLSDPNTQITINGNVIPAGAINPGNNVFEFSSNVTNIIKANKPIQVVQYAVTQGKTIDAGCNFDSRDIGDPEMIYLNPVEQTINRVTLYSTGFFAITKHFINVVMRSDKTSTFKLDGQPYTSFVGVLNGTGYAYAQIPVSVGTHTLSADDGFNAIAYGFGDHESYGYSAGTNLKNLNEYIEFDNPATNSTQLNGCTGIAYKLELVLPYISTSITWNFNNGSTPQTIPNPPYTTFVKDGTTLYRYQYPGVLPPFTKGNYSYTATVVNPSAIDDCGTSKDIDFDFNIADFAITDFKTSGNLCSATDITVHDESIVDPASVTQIKLWWDYINHPEIFELYTPGTVPADKNYHHTYDYSVTSTNYTIKMIVYTGEGSVCENGKERPVTILGSPSVEMTQVAPMCQDAGKVQIIKNDKGFAGNDTFSGPGVSATGVFDPAVSGPGTFTIAYRFVATNGCDDIKTQEIVVNPLPKVDAGDFIPLLEGESVVIRPVVMGEELSYQWTPTAGLDNANVLNPICSAVDNTTYTLTVTTAAGCVAHDDVFVKVLKKPVIVSAFSPNGDGINDTWGIKYLDTYPGNTVDVYNRQGEKVYSSVGYASPWDGSYRGNALPTGTYYYIINPKNGRKVVSGSVTIIK